MTDKAGVPMPVEDAVRAALDDLWGCIGHAEMRDLQPETIAIAKANHEGLWHADEAVPWWMIWRRRQPGGPDA